MPEPAGAGLIQLLYNSNRVKLRIKKAEVRKQKRGAGMTIILIIIAAIAAIYIYAAIAYYDGFQNWDPLCGCKGTECSPKNHRRLEP
jgi:hypothetical protein